MTYNRGDAPIIRLSVPSYILSQGIRTIFLTFQQDGENLVEKTKEDIDILEDHIVTRLTQEETLKFASRGVLVQWRLTTEAGVPYSSRTIEIQIGEILKDGVI